MLKFSLSGNRFLKYKFRQISIFLKSVPLREEDIEIKKKDRVLFKAFHSKSIDRILDEVKSRKGEKFRKNCGRCRVSMRDQQFSNNSFSWEEGSWQPDQWFRARREFCKVNRSERFTVREEQLICFLKRQLFRYYYTAVVVLYALFNDVVGRNGIIWTGITTVNGFYIIVALGRMRSSTLFSCLFF